MIVIVIKINIHKIKKILNHCTKFEPDRISFKNQCGSPYPIFSNKHFDQIISVLTIIQNFWSNWTCFKNRYGSPYRVLLHKYFDKIYSYSSFIVQFQSWYKFSASSNNFQKCSVGDPCGYPWTTFFIKYHYNCCPNAISILHAKFHLSEIVCKFWCYGHHRPIWPPPVPLWTDPAHLRT